MYSLRMIRGWMLKWWVDGFSDVLDFHNDARYDDIQVLALITVAPGEMGQFSFVCVYRVVANSQKRSFIYVVSLGTPDDDRDNDEFIWNILVMGLVYSISSPACFCPLSLHLIPLRNHTITSYRCPFFYIRRVDSFHIPLMAVRFGYL